MTVVFSPQRIAYKLGYVTGWLWNDKDMPLGMSIGEVSAIGGAVISVLLLISLVAEKVI